MDPTNSQKNRFKMFQITADHFVTRNSFGREEVFKRVTRLITLQTEQTLRSRSQARSDACSHACTLPSVARKDSARDLGSRRFETTLNELHAQHYTWT